jgi:ATP-dependent Lon protease
MQKLDQLDNMKSCSDEYYKLLQWVESVAKLPIGKYKELPVTVNDQIEVISNFLLQTRERLDKDVYGHIHAKEHIIRLLAKWISNNDAKGLVIGLEGPMGTGKTSLCLEVCRSLDLPYGFVSLGGMSSSDYLLGHSYTYEGSRWGKIAEMLMHAGYSNPVLYFDELDKVSGSRHGEDIINTLIHITDVTQNNDFRDKYFSEVPIDLSKCIIIFSYNHGDEVNPILKDRMVTVKATGYNLQDKLQISKKHMIPRILKEYGFTEGDIMFDDNILTYIINLTEEEEGVRKLKRSLEDIVSQLNVARLLRKGISLKDEVVTFPLNVTEKIAKTLVTKKQDERSKLNLMYL